jgi:hypothetical protein
MPSKLRPHLTYANVVSSVCLFVVLGGSAYATVTLSKNSVKSKHIAQGEVKRSDIARDAVNSARIADFTLVANDFKPGQLPVGPQGPKGDPGATSLKVRAIAGNGSVTATCQPGERATGGGAHSVNGYIVASAPAGHPLSIYVPDAPSFQEYTPTSWTAAADNGAGAPADVTAWVVCAAP